MLRFTIRLSLVIAGFVGAGLLSLNGQTTSAPAPSGAATTNSASATPPPAAIPLGDIANQAQADTTKLHDDLAGLGADSTLPEIAGKLPELTRQINIRTAEDTQLFAANPTLHSLQTSQTTWQSLSDSLASAQKDLSQRAAQLDTLLAQLNQLSDTWKTTLDTANKTKTPPEITQRIQQVRALVADTTKAVQTSVAPLYSMQSGVAAQAALVSGRLDSVNKAIDTARSELFKQDHPPVWKPEALYPSGGGTIFQERASFQTQLTALKIYLKVHIGAVLIHLFLLALLVMGFHWISNAIHARAQKEPALQHAARVFDLPLPTALLLALLVTWFLYPDAPRLLWAVAGATALIPAVIVIRRLIDPANFFILYAAVIAYLVDLVRYVVTPAGIFSRFLLLAELLAVSIFLLIALRSKHLSDSSPEASRLRRLTRIYFHVAFLVFVFAGFANAFGYVQLSVLVGDDGMLQSSYLAVILYAAMRIADALTISALSIRPLSRLGMVRHHQELLYKNISAAIRWLAFGIWLLVALEWFTLRDPLWQETKKVLNTNLTWGSLTIQLGSILAFPITVWASFLISRFIRFCLEEEIYPHLQLGRGIPYAASTMVHYAILVVGFFVAVKAGGGDLTQFSFLAGAFGVGLGFGLQNIFNNFVSGVILLFERPVKVGDTIQIGTDMGTVERIGIRASVIQLTSGAEMIVPNGNLISNPVTNWTLSNSERLIEIPVNITSKVDPQHILQLLNEVALAHPHVLKNPAPQTLLITFGATLSFRLRAWIDSEEAWMKITSDLSLAINSALARENVTMS